MRPPPPTNVRIGPAGPVGTFRATRWDGLALLVFGAALSVLTAGTPMVFAAPVDLASALCWCGMVGLGWPIWLVGATTLAVSTELCLVGGEVRIRRRRPGRSTTTVLPAGTWRARGDWLEDHRGRVSSWLVFVGPQGETRVDLVGSSRADEALAELGWWLSALDEARVAPRHEPAPVSRETPGSGSG